MLKFRPLYKVSPMLDQAPCGPAVPCLSRQARAAVMVRLRGEADAGHRSDGDILADIIQTASMLRINERRRAWAE